ncbi:MAG TPA: electron transport complex subunit RsxG [Arenimonas sp.]|uniref:electron transport complex subunit RsxG n=1 Tax=Arenimonas sp. TaxID=1872635 RepID=UPI002B632293|nr:electron transport complex subunit RsxG [Arenimonas sp.]HMB58120.1 electron transport complex subunit RsxG [Arenimonas sp.]
MNAFRGQAIRAASLLGLIALFAIAVLAGVHALTRADIAAAENLAQRRALAIVLPMDRYDNDALTDIVSVRAESWLGSATPMTVRRARKHGKNAALVLDVIAPDGYAGPIHLLVGVDAGGRITGVRVTAHRETPGLGDTIDASKSDWIKRFTGRFLGNPPAERWAVKRDGGDFDQFAEATITPRAVVAAVSRCLQFVARHGREIYAAPVGTTLRFDDAPEKAPVQ